MNGDEVGKLLGLMALADNRRPPEDDEGRKAMIAFWLRMVGDLNYRDAAASVEAHYRESPERIMPSHIRERVRVIRQARLDAAGPTEIPQELAGRPIEARDWLQRVRDAIADGAEPERAIALADAAARAAIGGGPA